jgi:threonine dehydrogenase-like Zn-dependent dehydrogenase
MPANYYYNLDLFIWERMMKALMCQSLDHLELVDLPIPHIQPDELLIRTGAATICTSDVHDIHTNPFNARFPLVLGHEGAGSVTAIGDAVENFKIGDRVATHPVHMCRSCEFCQEGLGHLCKNMSHFGYDMPGVFAEYYRVRQDRARLIPDCVSFQIAALTEPVCVCLEALLQASLTQTSTLLIMGDGPFGLLMTRLAARMNIKRIVITGYSDYRLAYAHSAICLNTSQAVDPVRVIMDANEGNGYDAVILAVSSRTAFNQGMRCLRPRGRLVLFSAIPGETPIDLLSVHLHELEIVGACSDQDQLDRALNLLGDPGLKLEQFVTHQFPLEAYRQAFELVENGKDQCLKVGFVF